ncbi:hypothetical protein [Nitrosomonas aestuarii]|uniref:hypothetical protein n=1 Tax=Nitrosomonas aestuarii TaxID=52441 RepID=UPI000D317A3F|nr:hypothetical protein [Nitrosomonas aestuarii]PTN07287.1 hypothetical protein C8R11_1407 [Nitrosomonas aestuarii]
MKNLRFNRIEKKERSKYIDDFEGMRNFDEFEHEGYIKCKLVHNIGYSVVCPDQIYFEAGDSMHWIQPLYFSGNQVAQFDEFGLCDLGVDISHGACLRIRFKNNDAISWLDDGSILYKCAIKGPKFLYQYRTGDAKIDGGVPYITLYHHTSRKAKNDIEKGSEYWSTTWNIQGTKKSINISYLYLTSLPKISNIDDLTQIAMSSQGKLAFRVDSNFTSTPDLVLDVYRESTSNRTHTLSQWVNASYLSPQPCYRHLPPNGFGYHAIVSPFIQRIGVEVGSTILIENGHLKPKNPKSMGYTVIGEATTVIGLEAPYDEENTEGKLMIEFMEKPEEIIEFWMKNANKNQTDNKPIEEVVFE